MDSETPHPHSSLDLATPATSELLQKLSSMLEGRGVFDDDSMGLAFHRADLSVAFLNTLAKKILCPVREEVGRTLDLGLADMIAVESKSLFEANLQPMLKMTGSWSGELVIRDMWGGDISVRAHFWTESVEGDGDKGEFVFFHGEPPAYTSFRSMQGWKDRQLLLALLGNTPDAVYFKDKESRFLRASSRLVKMFGLKSHKDLIGKTDFHFFAVSHAAAAYADEQGIIETGQPILNKEEMEVWDDQSITWALTTKLPYFGSNGEIIGTFGISRDITEEKRREEERQELEIRLQLAQRLEAIGSLAAGVAHEINTPTQFVSDNTKFLGTAFSDLKKLVEASLKLVKKSEGIQELDVDREAVLGVVEEIDFEFLKDEVPQSIEQSMGGLHQISRIVGSLKEFSYPSSPDKAKSDLNHAIENTLNVSRNEWKGVAEVDLDLQADLPEVECMVDEVSQVILNLIVNAAHAIEGTETRQGRIGVRSYLEGDCVCIEIKDTGTGMPDEVKSRLFEPFFTTKQVGKGTGQGLAMARNVVVKSHGGRIDFESEEGKGSVFTVRLPIDAPGGEDEVDSQTEAMV